MLLWKSTVVIGRLWRLKDSSSDGSYILKSHKLSTNFVSQPLSVTLSASSAPFEECTGVRAHSAAKISVRSSVSARRHVLITRLLSPRVK